MFMFLFLRLPFRPLVVSSTQCSSNSLRGREPLAQACEVRKTLRYLDEGTSTTAGQSDNEVPLMSHNPKIAQHMFDISIDT